MTIDEKKRFALELYLYSPKEDKEIAQMLKINPVTFSKWKTKGGWKELKGSSADAVETGLRIVANVLKRALDISNTPGFELKEIRDAGDAIDKFMPKKSDFAAVSAIGQQYTRWLLESGADQSIIDNWIADYKRFSAWYLSK